MAADALLRDHAGPVTRDEAARASPATSAAAPATPRSSTRWWRPAARAAGRGQRTRRERDGRDGPPAALGSASTGASRCGRTHARHARYTDDLSLPGMLHARILRSPHAHARIVSHRRLAGAGHAGRARGRHGRDLPEPYGIIPWTRDETRARRRQGAATWATGSPAWRPTTRTPPSPALDPHSTSSTRSCRPSSIRPRRSPATSPSTRARTTGNVTKHVELSLRRRRRGAGAAPTSSSRASTSSRARPTPPSSPTARSPASSRAACSPCGRRPRCPHYLHRELARVLGVPAHRIRVIQPPLGGALRRQERALRPRVLRREAGDADRPPGASSCYTREEVFYAHRGRHPMQHALPDRVLDADGTLTARRRTHAHRRRRLRQLRPGHDLLLGAARLLRPTPSPPTGSTATRVYTNKPACGPKRGHGSVQPRFAFEVPARQGGRRPRHRSDRRCAARTRSAPTTAPSTSFPSARTASSSASTASRRPRAGGQRRPALPFGRGLGVAGATYITRHQLPRSTPTRCRRLRCRSPSTARAAPAS